MFNLYLDKIIALLQLINSASLSPPPKLFRNLCEEYEHVFVLFCVAETYPTPMNLFEIFTHFISDIRNQTAMQSKALRVG